jgi:hypothetical protein
MRTVRTKVYKFEELSNEAKAVAIENYRNNTTEVFLDMFQEDCIEAIQEVGFSGNIKLQYDLGYSQGGGLSFSCDYFTKLNEVFTEVLGKGKEKTINCIINELAFSLEGNNGRYCFASKGDLDLTLENYNRDYNSIESSISKVREKLENIYFDLCKDLEKRGYAEIEWQNSDEYIEQVIVANEYEFTINGNSF